MEQQFDPNTFVEILPLTLGGTPIGSLRREYRAALYENVAMCDLSKIGEHPAARNFKLELTQRVRVYNPSASAFADSLTTCKDYPVLLVSTLQIKTTTTAATATLLSYSPQTVNSKVETVGGLSNQDGTTQQASTSSTIGSSQSQTNSYGATVSASLDGPSSSANYEHSTTTTEEQSKTNTEERGRSSSNERSRSASMSIKDWGSYSYANPNGDLSWVFGQEYPWDAITYREFTGTAATQQQLLVPQAVMTRLYDQVTLCPPSQLSIFGFDFVMKSIWMISVPNNGVETLEVGNQLAYYSASHSTTTSTNSSGNPQTVAVVYRDVHATALQSSSESYITTTIDVALLALDAVGKNGNSAIAGLIQDKFTTLPVVVSSTGQTAFSIPSLANDLIIRDITPSNPGTPDIGSGFAATDTGLIGYFTPTNTPLTVRFYFKVADVQKDYSIYLKHWKMTGTALALNIVINGSRTINRTIDALEAEGGEGNLTVIKLRELNFASVDFHDYLQLGLNTVDVTITPAAAPPLLTQMYLLLAASVERE